jgi:hypothetical protein
MNEIKDISVLSSLKMTTGTNEISISNTNCKIHERKSHFTLIDDKVYNSPNSTK